MSIQYILRSLVIILFLVFSVSQSGNSQDFQCIYTQITDTIDADTRTVSTNSDGSLLVFVSDQDFAGMNVDGNLEIFLYDVFSETFTQITDTTGNLNISPTMSGDGSLVVFRSTHDLTGFNPDGNSELFLLKTDTLTLSQITDTTGGGSIANENPNINSDGTHIAFQSNRDFTGMNADGNKEIFLLDIVGLVFTQITDTTVIDHNDMPAISFDGSQVSFQSEGDLTGDNADLSEELFLYDAVTDTITQVTKSTDSTFQSNRFSSFSPDGTLIAFMSNLDLTGENPAGNEIFLYDIVTKEITQITISIFPDGIPKFSPDGNSIIFSSENDITGGNPDFNAEVFLYDLIEDRFLQYTDSTGGGLGISASFNSDLTFIASRSAMNVTGENADESVEIFIADCIAIVQNSGSGSEGGGCSLAPSSRDNIADLSLLMLIPALIVIRRFIF